MTNEKSLNTRGGGYSVNLRKSGRLGTWLNFKVDEKQQIVYFVEVVKFCSVYIKRSSVIIKFRIWQGSVATHLSQVESLYHFHTQNLLEIGRWQNSENRFTFAAALSKVQTSGNLFLSETQRSNKTKKSKKRNSRLADFSCNYPWFSLSRSFAGSFIMRISFAGESRRVELALRWLIKQRLGKKSSAETHADGAWRPAHNARNLASTKIRTAVPRIFMLVMSCYYITAVFCDNVKEGTASTGSFHKLDAILSIILIITVHRRAYCPRLLMTNLFQSAAAAAVAPSSVLPGRVTSSRAKLPLD